MKQTFLCVVVLLFLWCRGEGQEIEPLSIGDSVPDIVFDELVNDSAGKTKLSDFKGKLIFLDFWATWCGPCIKGLPKLDSFQQRFGNRIKILPISTERKKVVEAFFTKRKDIKLSSALVTAKHPVKLYFPHKIIPHLVIISPNGVVAAITSSSAITHSVVEKLLADSSVDVIVKTDVMDFKPTQPLFLKNNGGDGHQIISSSLVSAHVKGLGSMSGPLQIHGEEYGFHLINVPLVQLYLYALSKPSWYWYTRTYIEEGTDASSFVWYGTKTDLTLADWGRDNTFCYEIRNQNLSRRDMLCLMRNDLNEAFPAFSIGITERQLSGYKLIYTRKKNPETSVTTSAKSYHDVSGSKRVYRGINMNEFAVALETAIGIPVANGTNLQQRIDIELPDAILSDVKNTGDIQKIRTHIKKKGFDLVPYTGLFEVINIGTALTQKPLK